MSYSKHIFLSYRSTEAEFALKLATDLKNAGVYVWIDRLDIRPGEDWRRALERGINNCAALLTILSPAYIESTYCQRELARADRLDFPIIPILLQPLDQAEWPLVVELYQYIDFTHWTDPKVYEQKLKHLIKFLRTQFANQLRQAPPQEEQYLNRLIAELEVSKRVVVPDDDARHIRPMTAINILLDADVKVYLRNPKSKTGKVLTDAQTTVSLRELIKPDNGYPRYTLVGEPGAGKTAVLEYLVVTAAYHKQKSASASLPFLVQCVDWKTDISFQKFIESQWIFDTALMPQLQDKKVTLYVDGLDEIADNQADKIKSLRDWLHMENSAQVVVITCRHSEAYLAESLELPIFYITNLDSTRVKDFIHFFLPDNQAQQLLQQIEGMRSFANIDELLADSLLLSLIIEMYSRAPNKQLPANISILIEQLVEKLWVRERDRRVLKFVSYEELDYTLSELAYQIYLGKSEVSLDYELAHQVVDNQLILQFAQRMHLLKPDPSQAVVRFNNKLLTYYFAARWLILQGQEQTWLAKADNIRQSPLLTLLVCGMASRKIEIIQSIAQVDLALALQCIRADASLDSETFKDVLQQFLHQQIAAQTDIADIAQSLASFKATYSHQLNASLFQLMRQCEWELRQTASQLLLTLGTLPLPGLQSSLTNFERDMQEPAAIALSQLGETALPTLIMMAQDENPQIRRNAIWAFSQLGDLAAIPTLVCLLQDDQHEVVMDAVEALGYLYDATSVPFLIETLGHRKGVVRNITAETLRWIGQLALPDLIHAVHHKRVTIRQHAVTVLQEFSEEMATQALIIASYDDNVNVKIKALDALEDRREPAVFKRFVEALLDKTTIKRDKETVAERAARALEKQGTPESERVLAYWRTQRAQMPPDGEVTLPEVDSESPATIAKDRLTKLSTSSERTIPANLQVGLRSSNVIERQQAVQSLVHLDEALVTPILRKALRDSYPQVRLIAVKCLARYTAPDALKGLVWALSDDVARIVDTSALALQQNGKAVLPELMTAVDSPKTYTRQVVIKILGELGEPIAIPVLKAKLNDHEVSLVGEKAISDWAYLALKSIGTPEADKIADAWLAKKQATVPAPVKQTPSDLPLDRLPELIKSIEESGWGKREEAAKELYKYIQAIKGTEFPEVRAQLTAMLDNNESVVCCAGLEALAWLGDKKAIPAMLNSLEDKSWTVRIAAIRSLIEIGDSQAASSILELVLDKHNLVKEAALEAIGILGDTSIIRPLVKALESTDSFLRLAAIQALDRLHHPDVVIPLAQSLRDPDKNVRWAAVNALRNHNDERAVRYLNLSLYDEESPHWEDETIPQIAAEALENIGTEQALSAAKKWRQIQAASTHK